MRIEDRQGLRSAVCAMGLWGWAAVLACGVKSSISIFEQFFASIDKIFILGRGLGAGL